MTATVARPKQKTQVSSRSGESGSNPKRPKLRIVDKAAIKRRARRRALITVSAAVVAVGVFAVALGYAQLAKGQQHLDAIRRDISRSEADIARLERDVVLASSPDAIVKEAINLGMVRAQNPVYLTASDAPEMQSNMEQAEATQAAQDALEGVLADVSDP